MMLVYHAIEVLRCVIGIGAALCRMRKPNIAVLAYECLGLNGCYGLACLILLNEYRFSSGAEQCIERGGKEMKDLGQGLENMSLAYWIYIGAQCFCCCTVCCVGINRIADYDD